MKQVLEVALKQVLEEALKSVVMAVGPVWKRCGRRCGRRCKRWCGLWRNLLDEAAVEPHAELLA